VRLDAASNNSWIHVTSGSSGTGSGTVNYSVDAMQGLPHGTMTIAGHTSPSLNRRRRWRHVTYQVAGVPTPEVREERLALNLA